MSHLLSRGSPSVKVINAHVGKALVSGMDSYGEIKTIVAKEMARDKKVIHRYIKLGLFNYEGMALPDPFTSIS